MGTRTQTTNLSKKFEMTLKHESILVEEMFDELNILKDQINEKYEALKKLNSDIHDEITDDDFDKEIESAESYSGKIIESRNKITKFLNKRAIQNRNSLFQNVSSHDLMSRI